MNCKKYNIYGDPFLSKCINVRDKIITLTEIIKTGDWPEENGVQIEPKMLKGVYSEAIQFGLDVPALFKEFIQALPEENEEGNLSRN